jgi:hypothetical protein
MTNTMHDDAKLFDEFAIELIKQFADTGKERIEFPAASLPNLAGSFSTRSIVVKKTYHHYEHFYRAESLEFLLSRSDCQRLALAFLAVVMLESQTFVLHFTHPDSQIRSLRVPRPRSEMNRLGLQYVGTKYIYLPTDAMADLTSQVRASDRPVFKLCADRIDIRPKDWEGRNVVEVDASDVGLLLTVQMLLNLARGPEDRTELELLGLGGCSVGPGSAEARFWLPGSIARSD